MQICVIISIDEKERLKSFMETLRPFSANIERCYADTGEDFMNYLKTELKNNAQM